MTPAKMNHESLALLPRLLVEPIVRRPPRGSRTGRRHHHHRRGADHRPFAQRNRARQAGVVAGADAAALAFTILDPSIAVIVERPEASR